MRVPGVMASLPLFVLGSCAVPAGPSVAPSVGARLPAASLPQPAALRGDHFVQFSPETGRNYQIHVRLPERYETDGAAPRYPVVYLLDGDSLFPLLAAQHLFLGYDDKLPEAVIVGIAYGGFDPAVNKRALDFTAPAPGVAAQAAGAPAFLRFVKDTLLPAVEGRYRIDPARRVLFGQSRGGSFVLYSGFADPDLFWGRIASNPSFTPDGVLFFGDPPTAGRNDVSLVVASGTRDRPHSRAEALRWFKHWESRKDAPWTVIPVHIEGGTHAANAPDAYRAGMRWLFDPGEALRAQYREENKSALETETRKCAASGGALAYRGLGIAPYCIHQLGDAGKSCRGRADCQGECIVDLDGTKIDYRSLPKGTEAAGRCTAEKPHFGCYIPIQDGKAGQAICAD